MRGKIKSSLSIKVFLWIAVLVILCSISIYGMIMVTLPQSYRIVYSDNLERNTKELLCTLSELSMEDAKGEIERFCIKNHAAVTLQSDSGNIAFDYLGENDIKRNDVEKNKIFTMAGEADLKGEKSPCMVTVTAVASVESILMEAFLKMIPYVMAVILLIGCLGGFFCSRIIVSPISEISAISKRMAKLDMTWNYDTKRTDEIGVLADSLNTMAFKLDEAMLELENANKQLTEDMEQISKLSAQRRDFFAAASHELKTPVTILKGQIESMILGIGDYQNTEKYLPETLKAVEWMEQLVKEILMVSKIEMNGFSMAKEQVSVSELLMEGMGQIAPLADEKKIEIVSSIAPDVVIEGNHALFEKALLNILSNAARYSPEGETIYVTLYSDFQFECKNTGVVIPQEDIPLLFTPFCRMEKSHNKQTGGSGLGLYIVKTILELHNMDYNMESRDNSVCFHIDLNSQRNIRK